MRLPITIFLCVWLAMPSMSAELTVPGTHTTPALAAAASADGDTVIVTGGPYAGFTETTPGVIWRANGVATINSQVTLSGGRCVFTGFTVAMNFTGGNNCIEVNTAGGNQIYLNTLSGFLDKAIYLNGTETNIVMFNPCTDAYGEPGTDGGFCIIVSRGDGNLVAFNPMHNANIDYIGYAGDRLRFLYNSGRNPNTNSAAHVDWGQTGGTGNPFGGSDTLWEGSYYEDSIYPAAHHHGYNTEDNGLGFSRDLRLRNVMVRIGNGVSAHFQTWSGMYFVHEGYFGAHRQFEGEDFDVELEAEQAMFATAPTSNMRVRNSTFIDAWGPDAVTVRVYFMDGTGLDANFNHAWDTRGAVTYGTPFTSEANELTSDPQLVDYANDDFRLTSGSPGRASGGLVTLVASAGGTGTTLDLDDGAYVSGDDPLILPLGGALVEGHKITIGTDQVQVETVSGNTITFSPSITWAENDPVYHGWTTTPDRGPYPFGHVRLTAATYTGTTVTPNGDCAFVMAFTNNVPAAIDRVAPFTFAALAGLNPTYVAVTAYASPIPYVIATSASAPSAPVLRSRMRGLRLQ